MVKQDRGGTYIYEYGAPPIGRADASSSMMGRHKNSVSVATNSEIGELHATCVRSGFKWWHKTHYTPDTAITAGSV
jgi:hypothetical protein